MKKPVSRRPNTKASESVRTDIAERVFAGMRAGKSAHKACADAGLSQSTLNDWLNADAELSAKYARARSEMIDFLAEDLAMIADADPERLPSGAIDNASINKQRLQVDTRKWLLSKLAPRKYGDKIDIEHTGANGGPIAAAVTLTLTPDEAYKRMLNGES